MDLDALMDKICPPTPNLATGCRYTDEERAILAEVENSKPLISPPSKHNIALQIGRKFEMSATPKGQRQHERLQRHIIHDPLNDTENFFMNRNRRQVKDNAQILLDKIEEKQRNVERLVAKAKKQCQKLEKERITHKKKRSRRKKGKKGKKRQQKKPVEQERFQHPLEGHFDATFKLDDAKCEVKEQQISDEKHDYNGESKHCAAEEKGADDQDGAYKHPLDDHFDSTFRAEEAEEEAILAEEVDKNVELENFVKLQDNLSSFGETIRLRIQHAKEDAVAAEVSNLVTMQMLEEIEQLDAILDQHFAACPGIGWDNSDAMPSWDADTVERSEAKDDSDADICSEERWLAEMKCLKDATRKAAVAEKDVNAFLKKYVDGYFDEVVKCT